MPKKKSSKGYYGNDRTMRNAAQTLLANIRFASVDDPICSIVITSAVPNEGKSTISVQLARAIASGGRSVLLVECDMRRRSLAAELGIHAPSGLYGLISGTSDLSECITLVEENLYFLDVEPHIPNPPEIIASKRFRRFVDEAEERFDYVIFDTSPVDAFVDAAVLSSIVDATVLVVRENYAKRAEIREAYEQLVSAGANVVGVAMNCCHEEKSGYYYAYYDKEGNRVRTSDGKGKSSILRSALKQGKQPVDPAQSRQQQGAAQASDMPVNRTRPAMAHRDGLHADGSPVEGEGPDA